MNLQDETKRFYSKNNSVWPQNKWYGYTTLRINRFIYENYLKISASDIPLKILNAGSGGNCYGIPIDIYHIDICDKNIKKFPFHTVCSIEKLPFDNNTFDICICVGSVINYCDAMTGLHELIRCLKPGGTLLLEFESSITGELFFKKGFSKTVALFQSKYLGEKHNEWLYNPKYIIQLLNNCNGEVTAVQRFHLFSSCLLSIMSEEKACIASKLDTIAEKIPLVNKISSNVFISYLKDR